MSIAMLAHSMWMNGKSIHAARCPLPDCQGRNSILVKPDGTESIHCRHFDHMDPERPIKDRVVRFYFEPR